jgi:hypothetical protein
MNTPDTRVLSRRMRASESPGRNRESLLDAAAVPPVSGAGAAAAMADLSGVYVDAKSATVAERRASPQNRGPIIRSYT